MTAAEARGVGTAASPAGAAGAAGGGLFATTSITESLSVYVPATALFRLLNFARVVLLTWWMTQAQYGLFSIMLLVINVLTPLCSLGLNEAVARYAPMQETRGAVFDFCRRALLGLSVLAVGTVGVVAVLAPVLGREFFGRFTTDAAVAAIVRVQYAELARLAGVVVALLMFYFFALSLMKGLRLYRALALMELVHGVAFLGLAAALAAAGHGSAFTMTACYGISLLAALAAFGVPLARRLRTGALNAAVVDDRLLARRMLRFSLWATLASVTWQLLVYYPAWYLNKVHGPESVAVFSAVRQVGQFVLIGGVAIVTVVMSAVTMTWERHGRADAERQLSLAFRATSVALLLVCGVASLGRQAVMRLFAREYAAGADILPLQLLFFLIGANLAFLAVHFNLMEKTRYLFWPWAVGVAANVGLAYALVNGSGPVAEGATAWWWIRGAASAVTTVGASDRLGLSAASWAGVLAMAAALLTCVALLRVERRRLGWGSWLVLSASGLLALRAELQTVGLAAVLAVALGTEWIVSRSERQRLWGYVRTILRRPRAVATR